MGRMDPRTTGTCPNCFAPTRPDAEHCSACGQQIAERPVSVADPKRRRIGAGTVALIALIGLVGVIVLIGVLVVMSIDQIVEYFETYQDSDTSTTPVHLRNLELKQHLLELVNEARKEAGAPPVSLGTNGAAQLHAEQAVELCLTSHWDRYGLKPYIRHSLMGGHGFNREVTATIWSCDDSFAWYRGGPSKNMKEAIAEAIESAPGSPSRIRTVLDPQYSIINSGIAWDKRSISIIQHFETDLFVADEEPSLKKGILDIKGSTIGLPEFDSDNLLNFVVSYDPPPKPMGLNRLARTDCYTIGQPLLIMIQRPKELEEDYGGEDVLAREECPDPYKMDPNTPWPTSPDEIEDLLEETAKSKSEEAEYIYELHITAELEAEGNELHIRADIGKHLEERGPGVYTVFASLLKDQVEGINFFQRSFFYEVDPPEYYTAR